MIRFLKILFWLGVAALCAALLYGYLGYRDARADGPELAQRADALIAQGRSGEVLGMDRRALLLAVEDPAFGTHVGFDLTTPGAGATTITQSLSKREGFADFTPGLQKLRQTGYAVGLERALTKSQILALFLDSVPMGKGPDGTWIDGMFAASQAHFDAPPQAIALDDFTRLVAVMIAPARLSLAAPNAQTATRVARIDRLRAGQCQPDGHQDVWLEGCDIQN